MSEIICSNCLTEGRAKSHTRGSFLIELFLWLCFIIPGVIYSLWRLSTRAKVCPFCQSQDLVPAGSPRAKMLRKQATA